MRTFPTIGSASPLSQHLLSSDAIVSLEWNEPTAIFGQSVLNSGQSFLFPENIGNSARFTFTSECAICGMKGEAVACRTELAPGEKGTVGEDGNPA